MLDPTSFTSQGTGLPLSACNTGTRFNETDVLRPLMDGSWSDEGVVNKDARFNMHGVLERVHLHPFRMEVTIQIELVRAVAKNL